MSKGLLFYRTQRVIASYVNSTPPWVRCCTKMSLHRFTIIKSQSNCRVTLLCLLLLVTVFPLEDRMKTEIILRTEITLVVLW